MWQIRHKTDQRLDRLVVDWSHATRGSSELAVTKKKGLTLLDPVPIRAIAALQVSTHAARGFDEPLRRIGLRRNTLDSGLQSAAVRPEERT